MKITGIDTGKHGVAVILDTETINAWYHKLKYDKSGLLLGKELVEWLLKYETDLICYEKIQGRGGWGSTQVFNQGDYYGQLRQAVNFSGVAFRQVRPDMWQKLLHEGLSKNLTGKQKSEVAYNQLYPYSPVPMGPRGGGIDDNHVDALLIATYGVLKYGGKVLRKWEFITEESQPC